jgi:sec-independent protein translocase protein TatA
MGLDNPIHLAFLVLLLLLVFGAKRLPEMGRSIGAGMRGFRESISGEAGAAPSLTPAPEPVAAAVLDGDGERSSSEPAPGGAATALR